jgi:hypothetical protein
MREVQALNKAWQYYRGDMPAVLRTDTDRWGYYYQYASKQIFDAGWQAAMQYVEQEQRANQPAPPLSPTPELPTHE